MKNKIKNSQVMPLEDDSVEPIFVKKYKHYFVESNIHKEYSVSGTVFSSPTLPMKYNSFRRAVTILLMDEFRVIFGKSLTISPLIMKHPTLSIKCLCFYANLIDTINPGLEKRIQKQIIQC